MSLVWTLPSGEVGRISRGHAVSEQQSWGLSKARLPLSPVLGDGAGSTVSKMTREAEGFGLFFFFNLLFIFFSTVQHGDPVTLTCIHSFSHIACSIISD